MSVSALYEQQSAGAERIPLTIDTRGTLAADHEKPLIGTPVTIRWVAFRSPSAECHRRSLRPRVS